MIKISAVATMYNSSAHLPEYLRRMQACLEQTGETFEIILVNDGCPRGSLAKAKSLLTNYPSLRIVDLSRNFGHHRAMMVGLEVARGEWTYLTDSDLEEPPEIFTLCWHAHLEHPEIDSFYGSDDAKKSTGLTRFLSLAFHQTFNLLSGVKLRPNFLVSRLYSKRSREALLSFAERALFIGGVWEIVGFRELPVKAKKILLPHTSTYTLKMRIMLAINAITSFSERPLVFLFLFGCLQTALSILFILALIYLEETRFFTAPGWGSIMAALSFFFGSILLSVGLIGIYLARIFLEVKNRPDGLVRQIH